MKIMTTGLAVALSLLAQARLFADSPNAKHAPATATAPTAKRPAPATPPVAATAPRAATKTAPGATARALAAPAGVPALGNSARWYYLPAGWYILVPVAPNARVPSAVQAGPAAGNVPPAVALPAGVPPGARPIAIPVYAVPVRVPAANVAPPSWQHNNQNDNQWIADHGG